METRILLGLNHRETGHDGTVRERPAVLAEFWVGMADNYACYYPDQTLRKVWLPAVLETYTTGETYVRILDKPASALLAAAGWAVEPGEPCGDLSESAAIWPSGVCIIETHDGFVPNQNGI